MDEFRKLLEDYWFVIGPLLLALIANLRARYQDNARYQDWLDRAEDEITDYRPPLPSRARPIKRLAHKRRVEQEAPAGGEDLEKPEYPHHHTRPRQPGQD